MSFVYNPFEIRTCRPAESNCPPAPAPPWDRVNQSPVIQVLEGNGNIDLMTETTYLKQPAPNGAGVPYAITIPDGNFLRQAKTIILAPDANGAAADFLLSGAFVTFLQLKFTLIGTTAVLEWDGSHWQMIGGNAQQLP